MTLDDLAAELGVTPLTEDEIELLLDVARDVAHATERRYAPLSCFLLGLAAADGTDRSLDLRALAGQVRARLP